MKAKRAWVVVGNLGSNKRGDKMETNIEKEFEYFVKDGKMARRTFIKGVGIVAVASSLGFGVDERKAFATEDAGIELEAHAVCAYNCNPNCHIKGTVVDGKLIRVEPGALPEREEAINVCLRSMAFSQRIQDERVRVMYPLKRTGERGSGEFERISWDEAIDIIAEKLNAVLAKNPLAASFFNFTGNSNKLAGAINRMASCLGSSVWDIEGIMGDHGISVAMVMCFGNRRGGNGTRDAKNSKMQIYWGGNFADTRTGDARYVNEAREAGARTVVIDPRFSSTAAIADEWVPILPGTDAYLALTMMNVIVKNNLADETWLANYSCAPLLVRDDNGQYLHPATSGGDSDQPSGGLKPGETGYLSIPGSANTSDEKEDNENIYYAWDTKLGEAVEYNPEEYTGGLDDQTSGPESTLALRGSYTVNGVKCHPSYVDLLNEINKYDVKSCAEMTGLNEEWIEQFAIDFATLKPVSVRCTQGSGRHFYAITTMRSVATLTALCGYVGVRGGGCSHISTNDGGTLLKRTDYEGSDFNNKNWNDTGGKNSTTHKSSWIYDAAIDHNPVPIDFIYFANSNFLNMSPDAHYVINNVFPAIDFIVVADPFMTWTAKYADIVLPATSYWEAWDIKDKAPWVVVIEPKVTPMGESKSDCEIMSLLAQKIGVGDLWAKTNEEWVREMLTSDHPGLKDLDFEKVRKEGIYARPDGVFYPSQYSWGKKIFQTKTKRFEFYSELQYQLGHQVPTYRRMLEDPLGPLGEKYPLMFLQYHDRLNVHSQHILADILAIVQDKPYLQINPLDAEPRGIKHGDVIRMFNDRGECKTTAFVTEGIVPGVTAMASGWPPDYFIEGNHQFLTQYTKNESEELQSQTNAAFNDVLIQVEKA